MLWKHLEDRAHSRLVMGDDGPGPGEGKIKSEHGAVTLLSSFPWALWSPPPFAFCRRLGWPRVDSCPDSV